MFAWYETFSYFYTIIKKYNIMGETRELDFLTTISIIKAYKKRINEIDEEATDIWGEYFYEDYTYRCNRLAEERDICTLMVSYYTEKINETICLN